MKDHLRELIKQGESATMRHSLAREYLQARVLEALQDKGVFMRWAFVGGTALRFLYALPRSSLSLMPIRHVAVNPPLRLFDAM